MTSVPHSGLAQALLESCPDAAIIILPVHSGERRVEGLGRGRISIVDRTRRLLAGYFPSCPSRAARSSLPPASLRTVFGRRRPSRIVFVSVIVWRMTGNLDTINGQQLVEG